MAYSMFERPKLHNVKSLKFYPEEHDHHVSFRHKNLPPDFDLEKPKNSRRNHSIEAHSSYKCPIYVHTFDPIHPNEGDFVLKTDKRKKSKSSHRSVIEKLEEKYWAHWKPDKSSVKVMKAPEGPLLKNEKNSDVKVIKSAPERRRKTGKIPSNRSRDSQVRGSYRLQKNTSKSQEIQTDELVLAKEEAVQSEESKIEEECTKETVTQIEEIPKKESQDAEVNSGEVLHDTKFLKHTDSLILNYRKQQDEKEESFDQPKYIRLYKKQAKLTTKNYVKGGSYPLKSCLKKESSTNKGKLGRPGSPMIVSSSFGAKNKTHKR